MNRLYTLRLTSEEINAIKYVLICKIFGLRKKEFECENEAVEKVDIENWRKYSRLIQTIEVSLRYQESECDKND